MASSETMRVGSGLTGVLLAITVGAASPLACSSDKTTAQVANDGGPDGGGTGGAGTGGSGTGGSSTGGSGTGGSAGTGGGAAVACQSSLDCVGAPGAPICDRIARQCVACLGASDCPTNNDCTDRTCVPYTPCASSLDCPLGQVCDRAAGRCVDCLTDSDCSSDNRCVNRACRPACVSDNDCTPLGLLCDQLLGVCVRCLETRDCPDGQECRNSECVPAGACPTATLSLSVPLDMYILMDRSGSMASGIDGGVTVWEAVKSAIIEFVGASASAGIGVGLQFFPVGTAVTCPTSPPCPPGCTLFGTFCLGTGTTNCDPNDYLPPAVAIQTLPGVAQQIVDALNAPSPSGGTPTLPAMQSAAQVTAQHAAQNPDHKVVIVLATDGEPNDCNSTISSVATVAASALADSPSVATFVIGIGNIAGLDTIAQSGGTGSALAVNAATASQDFLEAMNLIRGQSAGCVFRIPPPPSGQTFDAAKVNVQLTTDNQAPEPVSAVADATECDASRGGWYYDAPSAPTEIRLCPATCDTLKTLGADVDIVLGCPTVRAP